MVNRTGLRTDVNLQPIDHLVAVTGKRIAVAQTHDYPIEPYGFIERIEVTPRQVYLPNMDTRTRYRLTVSLRDGNGNEVECDVVVVCRDVKEPRS